MFLRFSFLRFVYTKYHAKSGASSLKIERVMLNLVFAVFATFLPFLRVFAVFARFAIFTFFAFCVYGVPCKIWSF